MRSLSSLIGSFGLLGLVGLATPAFAQDIPAARVVVPWQDFKTLWEKGQAPPEKPAPAPRDFAISSARYVGTVDGESTVFRVTLQIDVLKDKGWAAIPVLPASVALVSARTRTGEAPVYIDGGWYTFITDDSGPVTLTLDFAVSTFDEGGQAGFAFRMPQSGGTEVELTVPGELDLDFQVAGAQQVESVEKRGARVMTARLPATGNLAVSWQRAQDEEAAAAAREGRIYAEHHALVGVGEGLIQGRSTVSYSILFQGTDQLQVDLPADVTVLDVTGQGLGEWAVTQEGGRNVVTADLNFEALGAYQLTLDYERPLAEAELKGAPVPVPDLQVRGAERVKGFVGVDARSTLEVKAGDAQVARPIDVRELPASILGQTDWPVLLGYRYGKAGWSVPLEIRQHDDVDMLVTIIDQAAATTVITPDGRRMTQVVYAMRNNRAQFLELELPAGATPWSTFVGGKAVKPARTDDGKVLVPLARSQSSGGEVARFAVEMVYVEDGVAAQPGDVVDFHATLPRATVPSTSVAWTVYVPDEAKVKQSSIDGSLRQVEWFTPIDLGGVTSAEAVAQVQAQAQALYDSNAMSGGVQPVKVELPLDGVPMYFEKLLVMGEELDVGFSYKVK
ncbi:MAG: hypothetical protein H6742_17530 [Alphaproteobacteria bacterium]|nr:hypothetical protein [Alphaproteobacteria bacterium]